MSYTQRLTDVFEFNCPQWIDFEKEDYRSREEDVKWFASLQPHLRTPESVVEAEAKEVMDGLKRQDLECTPSVKKRSHTYNIQKVKKLDFSSSDDEITEMLRAHNKKIQNQKVPCKLNDKLPVENAGEDSNMPPKPVINTRRSVLIKPTALENGFKSMKPGSKPINMRRSFLPKNSNSEDGFKPVSLGNKSGINSRRSVLPKASYPVKNSRRSVLIKSNSSNRCSNLSSPTETDGTNLSISSATEVCSPKSNCSTPPCTANSSSTCSNPAIRKTTDLLGSNRDKSRKETNTQSAGSGTKCKVPYSATYHSGNAAKSTASHSNKREESLKHEPIIKRTTESRPNKAVSTSTKTNGQLKNTNGASACEKDTISVKKPSNYSVGNSAKPRAPIGSTRPYSSTSTSSIKKNTASEPNSSKPKVPNNARRTFGQIQNKSSTNFSASSSLLSIINAKSPARCKTKEVKHRYSVETPSPHRSETVSDDGDDDEDLDSFITEKLKQHNAKVQAKSHANKIPGKTSKTGKAVSLHLGSPSRPKARPIKR